VGYVFCACGVLSQVISDRDMNIQYKYILNRHRNNVLYTMHAYLWTLL